MSRLKDIFRRKSNKQRQDNSTPPHNSSSRPVSRTEHGPGFLQNSAVVTGTPREHSRSNPTSISSPSRLTCDLLTHENNAIRKNLWTQAFELVREREPDLMLDFETHLAAFQDEFSADTKLLSRPQRIEQAMRQLLANREKEQWHFSIKGKDRAVREQVEKLAAFLVWSDGIVKQAVSAQPYAALAWSGVSLLLPLLTTGPAHHLTMMTGFNNICDLQLYWKTWEDTFLLSSYGQNYTTLNELLSKVYSYVVEYQARAICHLSSRQLVRAWQKVAGWNDWDTMERHIVTLNDKCKEHIDALHKREVRGHIDRQLEEMAKSRKIEQGILQTLEEARQDEKETELLHFLASATIGYEADKDFNPARVKGTCEWFLADERFCDWRDGENSGVLWVSAGPGCGKSVLSRALIDERHLSTSNYTIEVTTSSVKMSTTTMAKVCYFFFKDGDEQRTDGAYALCAVLHQLFSSDLTNALIKNALPSYKNHGRSLLQNFPELWRILTACLQSPDGGNIICIFDALDECSERSRRQIIDTLAHYFQNEHTTANTSKLKVLITSRPYDVIQSAFTKAFSAQATYMHFEGDDRSEDIASDINRVIDARLPEVASGFDSEECRKLAERLKSMENRTYLWLHLTFNIIQENPSDYSRSSDIHDLLSDIPSEVSDAYEKILSRRKDTKITETLLQIILAATRPLTIDEANYALTLALDKPWFRSHKEIKAALWKGDVKAIVKNLCGLLVNVYNSQLFFIHQTAREFLTASPELGKKWKGRFFDLPHSHATISRSCLHYLQLPDLPGTPAADSKFLTYASKNWPLHYRSQDADAKYRYQNDARTLCRMSDSRVKIWGSIYNISLHDWRGWTDLILASFLGLCEVVSVILVEEGVDVDMEGGFYGTALQAASAQGHINVVQVLLSNNANVNAVAGYHKTAIASAAYYGREKILALILEKRGDDVQVTESMLIAAASKHFREKDHSPKKMMQLLLETRGNDVQITEDILDIVVKSNDAADLVELFLVNYGDKIQITEAMLEVVTAGSKDNEVMKLLLEKRGDEFEITEHVIRAAAENENGKEMLELLLEKRGDEFKITEDVIKAATENKTGKEILELLLEKRGDEFKITEDVIKAATANENGKEILELLLEKRGDEFKITQDIFEAAAAGLDAPAVMQLLIEKGANRGTITEATVQAAATNPRSSPQFMESRLKERGDEVIITETLVQASVTNPICAPRLMELLLKERGDEVVITETILQAAVTNPICAPRLMELLLKERGDEVVITETILRAAALNQRCALQLMESLLKECGDEVIITETLVQAAVTNRSCALRLMELLLKVRGDEVVITQTILRAAVLNQRHAPQLMELLLKERGDEAVITETLVQAAVRNWSCGPRLMELLLKNRDSEIVITENVWKDAAANRPQVMELLLQKRGDEIVVTEGVLKAAAANNQNGEKIVKLLLGLQGKKIIITEEVVEIGAKFGQVKFLDLLHEKHHHRFARSSWDEWYDIAKFYSAAKSGDLSIVKYLLAKGVNPDTKNAEGQTPLWVAAKHHRIGIVQALSNRQDVDVNSVSNDGTTPLHYPSANHFTRIVSILIKAGADPYLVDKRGVSPIVAAKTAANDHYLNVLRVREILGQLSV